MKLLVITYYWPPDAGGGVQRILKFCKYLKVFGHELVVVTRRPEPDNRGDRSLLGDTEGIRVYPVPFRHDPLKLLASKGRKTGSGSSGMKPIRRRVVSAYLQNLIWLNLFVPDAKIGWYPQLKRSVAALLEQETFDAMVTTGPPYTVHLVGLYLKGRFKLPWIVDARDPWVENVYYNTAYRNFLNKGINRWLERKVLRSADRVITVGEELARLLGEKIGPQKIEVIYNGYDDEDFAATTVGESTVFRLGYYGSLHQQQVPQVFLSELAAELRRDEAFARDFRLEIYGEQDDNVVDTVRAHIPTRNLKLHPAVPHQELQGRYGRPQVFLLLINNYARNELIITGKVFEYLHAGWPILGIGPPSGDAARLLRLTGAGQMYAHQDAGAVEMLKRNYAAWRGQSLARRVVADPLFNRRDQARRLEALLHEVAGKA